MGDLSANGRAIVQYILGKLAFGLDWLNGTG